MATLGRLFLLALCGFAMPAHAAIVSNLFGPPGCGAAIMAVERAGGAPDLPSGLLGAIARVESGRRNPATGQIEPWPWTANVEGAGYFYASKAEAIAAVRRFQTEGVRSIDVGCMQINLQQHPNAFPSLETAFDPAANAAYAAKFLRELHDRTNDWEAATGLYHSATPALGADYRRKVLAAVPDGQRLATVAATPSPLARAWAATLTPSIATPFGMTRPVGGVRPMGVGGAMLGMRGGAAQQGRTLAAYRAMPIRAVMFARAPFFVRR